MKTILITTDFSESAKNAADYAAQLSKITSSPLILFHSWSIPVMSSESFSVPISLDELEKSALYTLHTEAKRLQKKWGVHVETEQKPGFASEEIANCARENKVGLIIMGMEHRNKIGRVLGSVSTSLLHQNEFPILIVPSNIAYSRPHIFLFATDLHSKSEWQEFDLLADLATHFHAGLHILNAVEKEYAGNVSESQLGIRLEERLKNFSHTWHFPSDGDVVHAISKTAKEVSADWIAVVPHQLPWFKNLFHHSISSELTYSSNCPILALPERSVKMS